VVGDPLPAVAPAGHRNPSAAVQGELLGGWLPTRIRLSSPASASRAPRRCQLPWPGRVRINSYDGRMEAPRESWFSPKIEVRASRVHGRGTFALAVIKPGEVLEIWGEWWKGIKTLEYANNAEKAEAARSDGKVVMQWDDELFSIEERGADDGYFINHSCDGNLWFRDAFTLEARKPIAQGEELTLDYALFERDDYVANWGCECGSPVCRKKVSGQDWRLPHLQEWHQDHFSPLTNKKIARIA
jgi:uncharacterized protein